MAILCIYFYGYNICIVRLRSSRVYEVMWYEVEQEPTYMAYFMEFCGAWLILDTLYRS